MRDRIIVASLACFAFLAGMGGAVANPAPLVVVGSMGDDVLIGGHRPEIILGFAGNDVLAGGRKADTLRGGVGNDRLAAWGPQSGPDLLIGGGGLHDRCVGGPEDEFVTTGAAACEVVIVRNPDGSLA